MHENHKSIISGVCYQTPRKQGFITPLPFTRRLSSNKLGTSFVLMHTVIWLYLPMICCIWLDCELPYMAWADNIHWVSGKSLQKCSVMNNRKTKELFQIKLNKTWQLNASHDPGLDSGSKKIL